MNFGLGLRPDLESQHADAMQSVRQLTCAPSAPIPNEVDPRPFIPALNQGRRNTCCGHARALVSGFCGWIESGIYVPVSRRYCYLTTKIVDGTIRGGDEGASISGAALASTKYGECREETFPYWRDDERYSTGIPDAASREGSAHKIASHTRLTSVPQIRQFIGSGQGGVIFGISWTEGLASFRGRILTMRDIGGRYLGEHAVCYAGYTPDGRLIFYNSWGPGWGNNGTAEVDEEVSVFFMENSQHGHYGESDLEVFAQRPFKGVTGGMLG